ncbi:MAG: DNA pilot protein [Microvirus sp.]|nr:MAG: DNA pilot protein [Microvirus sp.]
MNFLTNSAASLIGGVASYFGQDAQNRANREMAQEQMAFQERMSNTAYQRATDDLQKAGLNPLLAYTQGGASTPGGSTAQMGNKLGSAVSSALDARRAFAEVENMQAQNKNLQSQNQKINEEIKFTKALTAQAKADEILKTNSAKSVEYQLPGLKAGAEFDQSTMGWYLKAVEKFAPLLNPLKLIAPLLKK